MKEFNQFLKSWGIFLSKHNFVRKGYFFINETQEFYQVIHFQKNKYSTPSQIRFTINLGITSKKVLEQKDLKFKNDLMNNQWECRIENLVDDNSFAWMEVNEAQETEELFSKLEVAFNKFVFPALAKLSDGLFLADHLLKVVINHPFFANDTVESLLILTRDYCQDRIGEVLSAVNSEIENSNDSLFVNEVMKDLS